MNRTFRPILVLAFAGAALAGCMGGPADGGGVQPLTPASRYTLQVEPGLDRIALAVHETGVSANQEAALAQLVSRFMVEDAPAIVVEAPEGADPVASEMAWRIRSTLVAAGAPENRVQVVAYAAPNPRAPVLAGFETVRAVVPQCGTQWGSLTRTANNAASINFGCAVNANLAAQIANPRDIVQPRAMTPTDAGRRSVVFDNYRNGRVTAAVQEELLTNRRVARAVD